MGYISLKRIVLAGIASLAIGTAVGSTTYVLTGIPESNVNPAYWELSVLEAKKQRASELSDIKNKLQYPNYFARSDARKAVRTPSKFYLHGLMAVSPAENISDRLNLAYQRRLNSPTLTSELYGYLRAHDTFHNLDKVLANAISEAILKLTDKKVHEQDIEVIKEALIEYRRKLSLAFGGAATVGSAAVAFFLLTLQGMSKYKNGE